MLTLDRSTARLNASPRDKSEAIRQVGELLVAAGCITLDYITVMLERVANPYPTRWFLATTTMPLGETV